MSSVAKRVHPTNEEGSHTNQEVLLPLAETAVTAAAMVVVRNRADRIPAATAEARHCYDEPLPRGSSRAPTAGHPRPAAEPAAVERAEGAPVAERLEVELEVAQLAVEAAVVRVAEGADSTAAAGSKVQEPAAATDAKNDHPTTAADFRTSPVAAPAEDPAAVPYPVAPAAAVWPET